VPAVLLLFFLARAVLHRMQGEQQALHQLRAEITRREATEAQLRQSQKMDAIGRLTGGVAHDFNNLLTIISGSLDLMDRRLTGGDPRILRLVANAREGVGRAAALTKQLLAFARRQPLEPRPTDINRLVIDLSSLLRRTLGEAIAIESVLGAGTWPTIIDPPQLENAIVNLAVNARDAMPNGGRLTIETANAYIDEAYAKAKGEIGPGQYVTLSVTDTGDGIPEDIREQIFEPFFTTKPAGQGTGLGLSQVFGFVKQSGGNVSIYSEMGRGTTVRLYLPRYVGAVPKPDVTPDIAPEAIRADVTVLLAEDDADVRQLTTDALTEFGYRVVSAENGALALAQLERETHVDLLLTDVVMPVMDGRALAEAAQKLRPDLRVIFMTGYTPNAIVHNGVLDPGVQLLTKPFTLRQLSDKLQSVLGDAPPARADQ
jgi:signal transduction histidine kinase/CheY-like chemotaxis protein